MYPHGPDKTHTLAAEMAVKADMDASASGTEVPLKKMDGTEELKAVKAPADAKTVQPVSFIKLFW